MTAAEGSPTRRNGTAAVVKRIRALAAIADRIEPGGDWADLPKEDIAVRLARAENDLVVEITRYFEKANVR